MLSGRSTIWATSPFLFLGFFLYFITNKNNVELEIWKRLTAILTDDRTRRATEWRYFWISVSFLSIDVVTIVVSRQTLFTWFYSHRDFHLNIKIELHSLAHLRIILKLPQSNSGKIWNMICVEHKPRSDYLLLYAVSFLMQKQGCCISPLVAVRNLLIYKKHYTPWNSSRTKRYLEGFAPVGHYTCFMGCTAHALSIKELTWAFAIAAKIAFRLKVDGAVRQAALRH
jgi:hypothetical protein